MQKNEFNICCNKYTNKKWYRSKKFLMNISSKGLKDSLECASIYKGTSSKRKLILLKWLFMDVWLEH